MPSAAFTVKAVPMQTLGITIRVNANTGGQLDVIAHAHIVVGYAARPRRVIFVNVSPERDIVASDDNSLSPSTTVAVVREYSIPAQPSSVRRCMGALVTFEGIDLREGTPEPSAATGSHAALGTMRARWGLVLLPDTNARM
ncbi:hypothetical protein HDU86_001114 [Geranomyces michiganensis]|nr:hypothetical protein HDU86_001114 [Geranomyces michiganensis]